MPTNLIGLCLRGVFLAVMVHAAGTALAMAATDPPPLVLEHLGTGEGLPQGTVFATLQDSQGFVWLGTQDGLVRYDGNEIYRYAYSRTAHDGLPGNYVRQIAEDRNHDLWIAIKDGGLARWNRATDKFTVYRHDPTNPASLSSDAACTVLVDARGRVWIGTRDAGINVLDPSSGHIAHLRHDPADPGSLADDRIFTLARDRSGTMWVGSYSGLDRLQDDGRFTHFRHQPQDPHSLSGNQVYRVLEDRSGTLWVGTYDGGLDQMDRSGRVNQVFRHDARQPGSLSNDSVQAILEDQAGRLWIGTADGLNLLNPATGQFSHYHHDDSDAGSLRDSYVVSLYEDATGLVWIGTQSGGVSRWNPQSWALGGRRPAWLAGGSMVTAFADDVDGKVWVGSLGAGLMQFDPDSGEAIDVDTMLGRHNAIGDRRVMALRQDRNDTLWIGTMTQGLKRLDRHGHLASIPVRRGAARSLSDGGIMTIFEAHDGKLWIGTHGGGANILDPVTGLVRQVPFDAATSGATSAAGVTAFAEDPSGYFWIGTDGGGLDLARPDGTVIAVFRHDPNDSSTLPANTVFALAIDAQGRIWVATDGGGVAQIDGSAAAPHSIRFQVASGDQRLASDTVYGVLSDAQGRLWLSGNAGLMRYDPEAHVTKTYHREHGLQGEEFNFGAYYRLRDGRLCFGGPGGFNIFDPARLPEDHRPPRLALTGLDVLGVPAPSATPYWLRNRIDVDSRASVISLSFSALDFTSPKRNRLAYRMAGLTDQWIDLGSQHRVTLTNLDAGEHVLEVRAANADSVWSDMPLRLSIHRDPAPWKSPWAFVAYAVAALGVGAYALRLQRLRFRRIVEAQRRLESEVALRTSELRESNQRLAEAAQAKSNFLDRMSHELRTPMNGVVGMTELLARTALSPAQARLTRTIRSSAQILLQIVNDLLDLSKIQAGKVGLEELPIDLLPLLEECTSVFMGAAEAKGIDLIVCPPASDDGALIGDPLRIRQILMNLIGNAVKFTAQGEIVVKADVQRDAAGCAVHFSVTDTGIGMDAATIERIFEPFTQADESTSRRYGGSGLGLAICRELAALLGGTIAVESRPSAGSIFRVTLPLRVAVSGSASMPPQLPVRRVRILTRRPALAESLARCVTTLGLEVVTDTDGARMGSPEELLIADAGSYEEHLRTVETRGRAGRTRAVVVASAAEVETQRLRQHEDDVIVVLKPVYRGALYEALSGAIGAPVPGAAAAAPLIPAVEALGAHVLLVEDEPVNAAVAQGYLEALGCTSVWVENGPEAVIRSAVDRFDVILMDLSMPGMDGFATTAQIRAREQTGSQVPIIALTAHDAPGIREACVRAGMNDLLSKPYTLEQCAQLLQHWVGPGQSGRGTRTPASQLLSSVDASAVARLRNLRTGRRSDLYSSLVDLFRTGSADSMERLRTSLAAGDLSAAAAICHKLASSAANIGALAFAGDVRRLGQRCLAGDGAGARPLHQGLETAYPGLLEELTRLQLRATA